jgi:hypothetical protein
MEKSRMQDESFTFDKFMDDILMKESQKSPELVEETPQQKYIKRYTERAVNRVVFVRKA